MTETHARALIDIYATAWETRDPELILTIFTEDATYHDPRERKNVGIEEIKRYWETKVVDGQKDITFELLNVWVPEPGNTVIAEWHATFIDTKRNVHVDMVEVAIFEARDGKFSSLREYYTSIKTPIA